MSTARRTHAIFTDAIDIDPDDRAGFIAQACAGDAALEANVRRLVEAYQREDAFLETPALGTRTQSSPTTPVVRGYTILRLLGSGGMATVYEALQANPERIVALKVMNRALAGTSALHRFRYETEVLARLQHPCIAQIHEAGTCDDGTGRALPFFAMELVAGGRTIVEHARSLPLRNRLALFAEVCDAVQHGHQLGVIHRDLKPANILVTGEGRPKVIDFGVARPTQADSPGVTQNTSTRQIIGTLTSMSPEQCAGGPVDARTDVYSLGAVLFELVSGRPPHDLDHAPIPEALRIIANDPVPRLGSLEPLARGDLEIIAAAALEKDRERRYASAGALGADIRRFLDHQPIDARRPTTIYQLRMFARRNRGVVVGASCTLLALVAGIAATSRMAIIAGRARDDAQARTKELDRIVAFQESQLDAIDANAMGDRLRASLTSGVRESLSRSGAGADEVEASLAQFARATASVNFTSLAVRMLDDNVLQGSHRAISEQFADQPLVKARLLLRLAQTRHALGMSDAAAKPLEEALALRRDLLGDEHPDTLSALHAMGSLLSAQGRQQEAIAILRPTHEKRSALLGDRDPLTLASANMLGGALRRAGQLDEAERLWKATLDARRKVLGDDHSDTLISLNNMGVLHAVRGNLPDAERCWRELLERRQRTLGVDHPDTLNSQANLGMAILDMGRPAEARPMMEASLAANRRHKGDDHPSTLFDMHNVASMFRELGELPAAEALQAECVTRRTRVLGPGHRDTLRSRSLLAAIHADAGRHEEAAATLRSILDAQRAKPSPTPSDTIETTLQLCQSLRALGRAAESAEVASTTFTALLANRPPGDAESILVRLEIGRSLASIARWSEAERLLRQAAADAVLHAGPSGLSAKQAAKALAELYTSWNRAEPSPERDKEAEAWRALTQDSPSRPAGS